MFLPQLNSQKIFIWSSSPPLLNFKFRVNDSGEEGSKQKVE